MPDLYLSQREQLDRNHQLDTYMDQLKYYRDSQKQSFSKQNAGKVVTTADLQKKIDEDTRFKNNAKSAGAGDSERWGIRALDLTNQFRAAHGLPALSWN